MTEFSQVMDFWANASDNQWHKPGPNSKPLRPKYRNLLDRAIAILGRKPSSAIDWGVGGGLVPELLTGCHVYGVDIIERTGPFESITIDIAEPEAGVEGLSVDLFVCLTTIQHFPNKAYAERIVRIAASVLVPGGVALFQIRTGTAKKDQSYRSRWSSATLFEVDEFVKLVTDAGFTIRYEEYGKPGSWATGYYYLIGAR